MSELDVLTALRAINCPLFAVCVLLLVIRLADCWDTFALGWKVAWHGFVLLLIGSSIGSAIKYLNHSPVDVSTALFTVGAVLVLFGLCLVHPRR